MLTHGGMGYAKEFHVERYFREAMIPRIAPVSPQMILCFIAEKVLGLAEVVLIMAGATQPLWMPTDARIRNARITDFRAWLARERGLDFAAYDALWTWSTRDADGFWRAIWEYFDVPGEGSTTPALADARMPGAAWFPDARLNYVDQVLRHATPARPAVIAGDETGRIEKLEWAELARRVGALAATLRARGVARGDRVAAYLPNRTDAVVAFLATASLGAIWSLCSTDMGVASVVDRIRQIAPKVLIATEGYRFGGKVFDRRAIVASLRESLPSVQVFIRVPAADVPSVPDATALDWADATSGSAPLAVERVPFDHPLWIVYSSGTTGLPKPIVHGHGGIVLENLKLTAPAQRRRARRPLPLVLEHRLDHVELPDGRPPRRRHDVPLRRQPGERRTSNALWRFADAAGATFLGSGAAFYVGCMKAGIVPREGGRLPRLRSLGSTGSPLPPDGYAVAAARGGQ